jgi:hypothetical protein
VLIQLPTGDWLDPTQVVGVEIRPSDDRTEVVVLFRGKVELGRWLYVDEESAEMARDEIARAVNLSLAEGGERP